MHLNIRGDKIVTVNDFISGGYDFMKKHYTKVVSVLLALCTLFTVCGGGALISTVYADEYAGATTVPTVYITGTGSGIYADTNDANSEKLNDFEAIPDGMIENIASTLAKPLAEAYLKNDFSEYCDLLVDTVSPYYEQLALDENGEASNGSGNDFNQKLYLPNGNRVSNGKYELHSYIIDPYDWRVDTFETADYIKEFIDLVKYYTGFDKVNIVCRCLGVNIFLSYIVKYGDASINKVIMYVGGLQGYEHLTAMFSGKIDVRSEALTNYINANLDADTTDEDYTTPDIDILKLVKAVIQVTNKTYSLQWGVDEIMDLYEKIYENVVPRIMKRTYGTMPGYWSMLAPDEYEDAIEFNFGTEREKYAGLIEKLDNYHYNVATKVTDIIDGMIADGIEVYNVVKWGFQSIPISGEKSLLQSDGDVTATSQSGGATTTRIGETFSDKYMAEAKEKGTDKYISADRQIDASTAYLADHTWFVKNLGHGIMPEKFEEFLFEKLFEYDGYMTVFDDPDRPQFLITTDKVNYVALTADNCKTAEEEKMEGDVGESTHYIVNKFLNGILEFFKMIKDFIFNLLRGIKGE